MVSKVQTATTSQTQALTAAVVRAPRPGRERGPDFISHPNAAMYKNANWDAAVQVERGISRERALQIAKENPNITFFFWVKGGTMVLEMEHFNPNTDANPLNLASYWARGQYARIFHHGDAVFFTGDDPWFGSAPGLADAYTSFPY